jgi:hypothetical protein
MTEHVWFIVEAASVDAFKADYDARGLGETVGEMQPNADFSLYFTGSDRCSTEVASAIVAAVPGTSYVTSWPPEGGWDRPAETQ